MSDMADIIIKMTEQLDQSNAEKDRLTRENQKLHEQIKELNKMNTHWQRYDSQRETHVLQLTVGNKQLRNEISDLQNQVEKLSICCEKPQDMAEKMQKFVENDTTRNGKEENKIEIVNKIDEAYKMFKDDGEGRVGFVDNYMENYYPNVVYDKERCRNGVVERLLATTVYFLMNKINCAFVIVMRSSLGICFK